MNTTKLFSTLSIILFLSFSVVAQTNTVQQTETQNTETTKKAQPAPKPRTYIQNAPIKEQFEFMMEKSSRYKIYKVIEIAWLKKFESGFVDSLNAIRQDYLNSEKLVNDKVKAIEALEKELLDTKDTLANVKLKQDSMAFIGIQMSKANYNLFIWSLVVALLALTGFFFLMYKRSHFVTRETQIRLEEVKEEFDNHRKNVLLREQKLARKLQDEINKNRNLGL